MATKKKIDPLTKPYLPIEKAIQQGRIGKALTPQVEEKIPFTPVQPGTKGLPGFDVSDVAQAYGISPDLFISPIQLAEMNLLPEQRTIAPYEQYLTREQAGYIGMDVPEGALVKMIPMASGEPQFEVYTPPPPQPDRELEFSLRTVYPEMFAPGATFARSPAEVPKAVTDILRLRMQQNYQTFVQDLFERVESEEAENILRMFGVTEEYVLAALDYDTQIDRITNTIQTVFPEYSVEDLGFLVETEPETFVSQIQTYTADGATRLEKRKLLQMMGYNPYEINDLLNTERRFLPIDGESKWLTIDIQTRNAYDDNKGDYIGTYNPATMEFTKAPPESVWKDWLDTVHFSARGLWESFESSIIGILPELLFPDIPKRWLGGMGEDMTRLNRQIRDDWKYAYSQNRTEYEEWQKKNPEIAPRVDYQEGAFQNPELLKDPNYWVYEATCVLTYVIPTIALALVGGAPLSIVGMATLEGGSIYDELIDMGVPSDKAAPVAGIAGIIIGSLEYAGRLPLLKQLYPKLLSMFKKEAGRELSRTVWKEGLKRFGKAVTVNQFAEITTEVAQEIVGNVAVKFFDKNRSIFESVPDIAAKTAIGMTPMAILGGAGSVRMITPREMSGLSDAAKRAKGWAKDTVTGKWYEAMGELQLQPERGAFEIPGENPYLKMPIERVRKDAQYGVKAAQEALNQREAGVQPSMMPEDTQISMDEQLKLEQARLQAAAEEAGREISLEEQAAYKADIESSMLKEDLKTDSVTLLRFKIGNRSYSIDNIVDAKEKTFAFNDSFTLSQAKAIRPEVKFSAANKLPNGRIRADAVLGQLADIYTGGDVNAFIDKVNWIRQAKQKIQVLADYAKESTQEVIDGITEIKEAPVEVVEEIEKPPPPVKPPPQTVDVPAPLEPSKLTRRNRVVEQSQEIIKQDRPGAFNRLAQRIPGFGRAMKFERPALEVIGTEAENLLVAQVAEVGALADVNTRQVATRLPLFKLLNEVFGEEVLRGGKAQLIRFLGTPEQAVNPITGSLLDIAQNPELYDLTPKEKNALQTINNHNDTTLSYVVDEYGCEIGRFTPKEGGAFLSNVDVSEDIIEWLGSETRAVMTGRGKTRIWQTARDRMGGKVAFTPELDVKKLIEGMDAFKASAAAGVTFKQVAGGLTRLETMQETHPELYDKMIGLRKKLQSLRGSLSRLNTKLNDAIDEFMDSPVEDVDLSTLQDSFDVQLESGTRVGLNIAAIQEEINLVKDNIKEIRPAWKVSNLKPFVFVQEGIYRYFPSKQAKYVIESRQTTHNPVLRFIEQWRAGAFSGDFSPFAIQGLIGVQADPIGSLKAFAGGLSKGIRNRDFLHSVTVEGLMDDIASDPESFAEFSSMMGRRLTGTPAEYAAGFLSKIPGFDKFTETTYVTVTRGSWNLWKRNWKRLVESGVPEIEAKVAAIEMTRKVYPLVAPAKLGQSQKRHALLRALPTSYSFIRQPATLMAQASMGYAKFITGQTLSIQERLAVRHMTTLAGSVVATSVTSAIVSAIAMGKDDDEIWQAALDAVNPDPFNGKFLSLIIGEFRIPLGGPYRSIFRAIYPQPVKGIPFPVPFAGIPRFIVNRITPALKTQINLLLNRDYFGKQLIKGEFPENLIRGILYELEGAVPLSIGETIGGIRREEATEDIARQAAAQFVGVNLIQLDNTYFHRVVLEMGTEKEDQLLYSKDRQVNTSKDLWGNVGRAISSLTVEEVKQRKGYPPQIAIIAEIRDLKKNVVDVLPNSKLKDIDFEMLSNRQDLLADEEKLAEFDKKYPYYSSVSLRQFDLLRSYHSANEEKQAEMIEKYPELTEIPRQEYLRSHPFENAQLAVWGQADILTREAYTEFKRLIKEYDIPDSAIPVVVIPPEESVDTHFDYMDAVSEYGGGSLEADVVLAKDDTYREWRGLQPPTSSVESLELKIANKGIEPDVPEYKDNQRKIQAYDNNGEEFVDKWVERGKIVDEFSAGSSEAKLWLLDNPDVHNWALDSGLLTDDGSDWNRESLELNVELRDLTEDSEEYTKLDTRRQAINEGFTNLDEIAEYSDLPAAGFRRARYLTEHTELAGEMSAIRGVEIPEYIPPEEYDELKEKDTLTPEEEHKVRAYEKKVPLEHIDNYVAYYSLERPEGVERWYEDDWFLMENADYYQNVYLGILGNQRADFRNVPTRAVYSKWIRYNDLPYGKARDQFRLDNKDLDEWGVNAGIWAMTMTEQRKKQDKTVGEKFIESIKGITALK